ncbi:MAG TPA: hypothetical protein VIV60_17560 [Polyangiaceae bacterium]
MAAPQAFPQAEPNDSDSVVDALDAGLLHWVKGERMDALRCLRLARSAADDAGNDQRALALARAAAELSPDERAMASSSVSPESLAPSVGNENQSTDARRSKLPEPPASPTKFTGATDSSPAPAAKLQSSRTSVPTPSGVTSVRPESVHVAERNEASNGAATSLRPSPLAARPSASPSEIASSSNPTRHANSSTAPAAKGLGNARAKLTNPSASASPSPRPEPADHRLATLRVRIERVEADGHVRVKLLDLAATASGEDNAILVVPQSLWQELKRGT